MKSELAKILSEIEEIIAIIGNYDAGESQFSSQYRQELTELFRKKIQQAKLINNNKQAVCLG